VSTRLGTFFTGRTEKETWGYSITIS